MAQTVLTVDQAAKRLQVHRNTVVGLINAGELEASKVLKRWRVTEQALADFLKSKSNQKKFPKATATAKAAS